MALKLIVKWSGQQFDLELEDETFEDLQQKLFELTKVLPEHQKLMLPGIPPSKQVKDTKVASLKLKSGAKAMLIGTPQETLEAESAAQASIPEPEDDLILDEYGPTAKLQLKDDPEIQAKLEKRIRSVDFEVITPPRNGVKCAVFDIDNTLFAMGDTAENASDLARPYMHDLLTSIYPTYDIIIWSATGAKWVEVKMKELGVLNHANYKIVCLMDFRAMVTVTNEKYGVFDCKPLAFIWAKFEQYNETNTVMIDDLRRNFVMNPRNGIHVRAYKRASQAKHSDVELSRLARYLLHLDENYTDIRETDLTEWRATAKRKR